MELCIFSPLPHETDLHKSEHFLINSYLKVKSPGAAFKSPANMHTSAGFAVKLTSSAVEYACNTLCAKYISSV